MKSIFNQLQAAVLVPAVIMSLTVFAFAQNQAPPAPTGVQTPGDPQSPAPERAPQPGRTPVPRIQRRPPTPPARVTVIADKTEVAPQVVTIVHRLSGLKMLRFLLRQEGDRGTLFTIDRDAITSDAHASIIAGWALDDGKTIVARLPQAGAEIEFMQFPQGPMSRTDLRGLDAEAKASVLANLTPPLPGAEADLTVVTRDGRRLRAHYVGLDGQTGLSVLQVNGIVTLPPAAENNRKLTEGQLVQVFAPQRTTPEGEASTRIIYVRVSKLDTRISKLARGLSVTNWETPSASSKRLTATMRRLSQPKRFARRAGGYWRGKIASHGRSSVSAVSRWNSRPARLSSSTAGMKISCAR
jgi:hypothetical protein